MALQNDIRLRKLQFDRATAAKKSTELTELDATIADLEMVIRNLSKSCKQLDDKAMSSYTALRQVNRQHARTHMKFTTNNPPHPYQSIGQHLPHYVTSLLSIIFHPRLGLLLP